MKNDDVFTAIAVVRKRLRLAKGRWPELLRELKRRNRRTRINYRWLVSFAGAKDKEPRMSRVAELSSVLGADIHVVLVEHAPDL